MLVVMGANPHASQGSLLACPDVMGEIAGIRARGGRVIVVDPRRTGTAERADEWLPIVPGTDAALLLAVAQVLFAEDLVDVGTVADLIDGVDDVRRLVADWTPERVADVTGIDAERIRALARELAATPARRGLRPHRHLQPGVRHAGELDGRRGERPHPALRRARRRHVLPTCRVARHRPAHARTRGRRAQLRPLAHPGAGCARGARPRPGVVPGRGDRHAGRGADPSPVHRGRATPSCPRPRATASTPRWPTSTA